MTITTEQAVALAEEHGRTLAPMGSWLTQLNPEQLTAMLNDNEQQVIRRLSEQSRVMPDTWISQLYFCNKCGYTGNASSHDGCNYAAAEAPRYTETMVREALAKMKARVEQEQGRADQAENKLRRIRAALAIKGGDEHYPTEWAYLQCCKALDAEKARVEQLERKLIECRSSVRNDANDYDRFILRKSPHCNPCDLEEQARLHDLRDWIDSLIEQRDAATKGASNEAADQG